MREGGREGGRERESKGEREQGHSYCQRDIVRPTVRILCCEGCPAETAQAVDRCEQSVPERFIALPPSIPTFPLVLKSDTNLGSELHMAPPLRTASLLRRHSATAAHLTQIKGGTSSSACTMSV